MKKEDVANKFHRWASPRHKYEIAYDGKEFNVKIVEVNAFKKSEREE